MQVFNAFMKVLKKKIFIAFIYIWVFVAVSIALTFSDSTSAMFEQTALNICVFDEDNTPESRSLCGFIGEKNHIIELENNRDIVIDALYYERVNYVLTIKKGYAENLAAGKNDDLFESMKLHSSYSTVYMGQFLNEYVGTVSAYMAGGSDVMTAISKTETELSKEAEVTVASSSGNEGTAFAGNVAFYFRFLPYIILGSVMSTLCPVLLVIVKNDIRCRTSCSGIHQSSYTAQIFAASTVYIIAEWLVFMIVGMFLNGGMYSGQQWLGVLNSLVFTLFSSAITIFVTSLGPSIYVINLITQILTISMGFLCGVFVEQDLLGEGVLTASKFMPAYWYIRVNRMLEGAEPFDSGLAAASLLIEAAFAAAFAVFAILVRKVRYGSASAVTV